MLSCKDISELASEHLDHKLPIFKQLQFKMHLMMCRNCRQFIEQIKITINTVSKLKPIKTDSVEIENQVSRLVELAKASVKEDRSNSNPTLK